MDTFLVTLMLLAAGAVLASAIGASILYKAERLLASRRSKLASSRGVAVVQLVEAPRLRPIENMPAKSDALPQLTVQAA